LSRRVKNHPICGIHPVCGQMDSEYALMRFLLYDGLLHPYVVRTPTQLCQVKQRRGQRFNYVHHLCPSWSRQNDIIRTAVERLAKPLGSPRAPCQPSYASSSLPKTTVPLTYACHQLRKTPPRPVKGSRRSHIQPCYSNPWLYQRRKQQRTTSSVERTQTHQKRVNNGLTWDVY